MTIVDADGRLFGRWNFIDVVIGVLVLALIPVGYAAYALFRTPEPRLTAVEPATLVQGPDQRVAIRGVNLRPYLRVSFNNVQGATFLFEDSTRAVVDLQKDMAAGVYDVVLYDFGQERHRLRQALTITSPFEPKPAFETLLAGRFINVTQETAAAIRPGKLPIPGDLIEAASPRPSSPRVYYGGGLVQLSAPAQLEVPALVKVPCIIKLSGGLPECGGVDVPLRQGTLLPMTWPAAAPVSFQIDQLRGSESVRTIRVGARFYGERTAVAAMKPDDLDIELGRNPFALGARVASLQPPTADGSSRLGILEARAQQLADGWSMAAVPLRIGGQFVFATARYSVTAVVLEVDDDGR